MRDWSRDRRWDQTRERLQSAVEELYAWQRAIAILGERYFQGICPLFPETEELLRWIVKQGDWLVEMFNDHLEFDTIGRQASGKKKAPPLPKPLDLVAIKGSAEARAKSQVSYLVDLARAQACEMMGERKRGLAFIERQISEAV